MAQDTGNMNVFTSSINNLPDLAKNYLFQVYIIPETGSPLAKLFDTFDNGNEEFMLRCKKVSLPKKSFGTPIETNYMGSKKTYPGRAEVNGTVTLEFDEFQDLVTSRMLHQWQSLIYDHSINEDGGDIGHNGTQLSGGAASNFLKDYSCKIKVVLYDSTLKKKLDLSWVMYQCWPNELSDVSLDMSSSEKITRSCTFNYNTFQMLSSKYDS